MGKTATPPPSRRGDPVWELLRHYPPQGAWTVQDYLALDENVLIEYTDGLLEFLPMPTTLHQKIVLLLIDLIRAHLQGTNALVLPAPIKLKVAADKFREPDIVCVLRDDDPRVGEQHWSGADLVVEVVSPGEAARARDYDQKPALYAAAGISEYWIVDPEQRRVTVLALQDGRYVEHHAAGDTATSALLSGFSVEVARLFPASA